MTSAVAEERGPALPAPNDAMPHGVVRRMVMLDRAPEESPVIPFVTRPRR